MYYIPRLSGKARTVAPLRAPSEDSELSYTLAATTSTCDSEAFSGTISGPDECSSDVGGSTTIECIPTGESVDILGEGDAITYRNGSLPFAAGWAHPGFEDSDWESGTLGIGYGDNDDATVLADMPGNYLTVFGRARLDLGEYGLQTDQIEKLRLSVRFDDGFVVHLNGQELERANIGPGTVTSQTVANFTVGDAPAECEVDSRQGGCAIIDVPVDLLVDEGENVLAFSAHNADLNSSDLSFIPTLAATTREVDVSRFVRGDCNGDGVVEGSVSDALFMLRFSFLDGESPPCNAACDANGDGAFSGSVSDVLYTLRFNFLDGPPPPPPFPLCGPSQTERDRLMGCKTSSKDC